MHRVPSPPSNQEFNLLSSLSRLTFTRFIAALMVVAFHFGSGFYPFNDGNLAGLFLQGPKAVEYFFLLSGFVLSAVYASDNPLRFNYAKFLLARFARIYPVFFLGLLFAYCLETPKDIVLLLNVTLTQAWSSDYAISMNNPGWSLSVEMFFYLTFPLLLLILTKKRLPIAIAICFVSYMALEYGPLYVIILDDQPHLSKIAHALLGPYFPIRNLPLFMIGATLGASVKFGLITPKILSLFKFPAIYIALLFAWLYYALPFTAAIFCLLILSLIQSKGPISNFFSGKVGVFLGESSYSLYILHYPLYIWYFNLIQPLYDAPETLKFYLYIILLLASSMLTFVIIETPCRKAIRWLGEAGQLKPKKQRAY